MPLQLQPETEISSNGDGSLAYIGEWDEAMVVLASCQPSETGGVYSFAAFVPAATISAALSRYTSEATTASNTDWSADIAAVKTAGKVCVKSARLRALGGGMGQLTLTLGNPETIREDIIEEVEEATGTTPAGSTGSGEESWSFGVSETPHSILDAETADVRNHIGRWMVTAARYKALYRYPSFVEQEDGEWTIELSAHEIDIANKILLGNDTVYTYAPTITLTIRNAPSDPTLPVTGSDTAPPSGVNLRMPAGDVTWRVLSSGSAKNSDGTWTGSVTWSGEVEED